MIRQNVLARARRSIGQGCIYRLGAGGMHPEAAVPWTAAKQCDCSGFAMWALGLSRLINGHWYDTSAIVADALNALGIFADVDWLHAQPGDLLVYGDAGGGGQGHVGVVATVAPGPETFPLTAIHCSAGNYRRTGDAIRETGVEIWTHHAYALVARYQLLIEDAAA